MHFQLHTLGNVYIAIAIQLPLSLLIWKLKRVTRGGMLASLLNGIVVFVAFGWPGYVGLLLYACGADLATRHSLQTLVKKKRGIDESKGKAADFGTGFLRGLLPFMIGIIILFSHEPKTQFLCLVALLAALATALGDTISTELGQAYGRRTYRLITMERVKSGTRGGISVVGSVLGGTAVVLFTITVIGLFGVSSVSVKYFELGPREMLTITLAAIIANHIESIVGGIFTQFQRKPNKALLNFLGSVVGTMLAIFFTNIPEG